MRTNYLPLILMIFFLNIAKGDAEEVKTYQTQFPSVYHYLDQFDQPLDHLSGEILLCTLHRTGANLTIAILNQLTGKTCLWSRGNSWEEGVLLNQSLA